MNFKLAIIFLLIKIVVSAIDDIQIIKSSHVDDKTEDHVIATLFSLLEKDYNSALIAKEMVNEMNVKYGKSWICLVSNKTTAENLYMDTQLDTSVLTLTYKDLHITILKATTTSLPTDSSDYVRITYNYIIF